VKIGFDLSRYFDRSAGVGIYAASLLKALGKMDDGNEYIAYSFFYGCIPPNYRDKKTQEAFTRDFKNLTFARTSRSWTGFKKRWQAASMLKKEALLGNVDVMHSTAYTLPELFSSQLVVTVHDLSFLLFPQLHTAENYRQVLASLMYLNARPQAVICDSEATKKDVIGYFHVPEQKLEVVHLGVDESFFGTRQDGQIKQALDKYGLQPGYMLCVSSVEPRKNFERIIKVFGQLIKKEPYRDQKLVCVGGRGWKNSAIYQQVKTLGLEQKIKFLGYVDQDELPLIYRGAALFLYPSLYEGFGLPVLEAMASGIPVITSKVSSLPEVAGQAAVMIDPYSEKELFDAAAGLLQEPGKAKKYITEGLIQARRFSWEKTARKTLDIYKKVVQKGKNDR